MTRVTNVPYTVRLGHFTYDAKLNSLLDSDGNRVGLRPQSEQVLAILVDHIDQTVTKEDLISTVWQNVSVTDDSLTQCIADIRRALGDRDRSILKTRPKVGYLLSATQSDTDPPHAAMIFDQHAASASRVAWVCIETVDTGVPLDVVALQRQVTGSLVQGDKNTVILSFADVSEALRAALKLSLPPGGPTSRIGVDLVPKDQGATDETSTLRVAGLSAIAQPSEVVASVEIRDQCYGEPDFDFEDLGQQPLDTGQTAHAFRVHKDDGLRRLLPDLAAEDLLPTIAIVPLRARVNTADTTAIGEVIADDLIATMSRSADINVISRLSTTVFRSQDASLGKIGHVLGADFVLSGTVLTHDAQVGMMLELSEVSTSKVLWAERIEVDVKSLLSGNDAAEDIVSKLRKAIALNEIARARARPISTLRNYTLLIGAVGLMHRLAPVDFELAGEMLRTLIERSPNQPAALSWMARWHVLRVQQGWSDDAKKEAQLALACSTKALDIDPENALALTSEGFVLTNLLHELDEAEDRYDAALEANPNDANGRLLRGTLFAFQGKGDAAKRDSERALHLAPQ